MTRDTTTGVEGQCHLWPWQFKVIGHRISNTPITSEATVFCLPYPTIRPDKSLTVAPPKNNKNEERTTTTTRRETIKEQISRESVALEDMVARGLFSWCTRHSRGIPISKNRAITQVAKCKTKMTPERDG
ncbi:hypothetical protein RUM44_003998 [Polyplax serrata]|uniref:Uncharacterized protein n=1 Tax=Polyplax serrata TaxID=468196 RepID=A0ABR1B1K3_POLSC